MALFSAGVEKAQADLGERLGEGETTAEFTAAFKRRRLVDEAEAVDDVVSRFCRAEIEGRAIGRYGSIKVFPALSDLVGTQLATVDQERVKAIVAKTVGVGYTFLAGMAENEDVQLPDRACREIWNVWAPGLNAGLIEQTALPPDIVRFMRHVGGSIFQADASALGFRGFRKKRRLGRVGAYYTQAGAILRALQTHPEPLHPDPASVWPYDEYPP